MARNPIEIPIASETRAFKQGVETGIIDPLEDAEKALKDLADTRGPEQLERDMKDAQQATEKLADETRDTARAIEREYKDAYRESRDAADQGLGRMRAAGEEVTNEIGSNLGEAVSSIRGDMSDLGQVGQDTLGGLAATVSSMGPGGLVGALALAAGAVGLGALTAGLEETEERQERLKEQASEWAQAYVEAGNTILTASQIVSRGQEIFGDPERYAEAQRNAKAWGVEISTAVAAMSGSQTAIDDVSGAITRQEEALRNNAAGADNYAQNIEAATTGQSQANNAVMEGRKAFDDLTGAMNVGQEIAGYMAQMMIDVYRTTEGATEAVDEFGDTVITLPDGKQIYIDAETGRATEDVDAIERKIYGIPDKTATVKLNVDDSAVRNYRPPIVHIPGRIVPRGTVEIT